MNNEIKMGKFLSLILRHKPDTVGIKLDQNGWADVSELIMAINRSGRNIDFLTLERIVDNNDKKRYKFNADKTKIRANQGHSIMVDVELLPLKPPLILYHGTADRFSNTIKNNGLQKQNRNHVHLSAERETAEAVGRRHGRPVVLTIDSEQMSHDGYIFYRSENGVWLTDHVPKKYIKE